MLFGKWNIKSLQPWSESYAFPFNKYLLSFLCGIILIDDSFQ